MMTRRKTSEIIASLLYRRWLADSLWRNVAGRLPRRLVMWCGYRIIVHATTGAYGQTLVPELTAMDAMKRWGDE